MLNRRPKKTVFLKSHKGRISYNLPSTLKNRKITENSSTKLRYSLVALEPARMTAAHIYAGEIAIKRSLKLALEKNIKGKLIVPLFPHLPVTKKPAEVRMGKGKGSVDY